MIDAIALGLKYRVDTKEQDTLPNRKEEKQ